MQRTLVLVKPDGVQRGLMGEVISRFENRGLRLVAAKFMWVNPNLPPSTMPSTRENLSMTL